MLKGPGITPIKPGLWTALGTGEAWRFAPGALQPFSEVTAAKVQANIWRGAAAHYLGRGLEFGVDVTRLVQRIREWRAAGRLEEAALLVTIVAGGIWHGYRRVTCGFIAEDDQTAHCVRCNRGLPDTALHRYWGCTRMKRPTHQLRSRTASI